MQSLEVVESTLFGDVSALSFYLVQKNNGTLNGIMCHRYTSLGCHGEAQKASSVHRKGPVAILAMLPIPSATAAAAKQGPERPGEAHGQRIPVGFFSIVDDPSRWVF